MSTWVLYASAQGDSPSCPKCRRYIDRLRFNHLWHWQEGYTIRRGPAPVIDLTDALPHPSGQVSERGQEREGQAHEEEEERAEEEQVEEQGMTTNWRHDPPPPPPPGSGAGATGGQQHGGGGRHDQRPPAAPAEQRQTGTRPPQNTGRRFRDRLHAEDRKVFDDAYSCALDSVPEEGSEILRQVKVYGATIAGCKERIMILLRSAKAKTDCAHYARLRAGAADAYDMMKKVAYAELAGYFTGGDPVKSARLALLPLLQPEGQDDDVSGGLDAPDLDMEVEIISGHARTGESPAAAPSPADATLAPSPPMSGGSGMKAHRRGWREGLYRELKDLSDKAWQAKKKAMKKKKIMERLTAQYAAAYEVIETNMSPGFTLDDPTAADLLDEYLERCVTSYIAYREREDPESGEYDREEVHAYIVKVFSRSNLPVPPA